MMRADSPVRRTKTRVQGIRARIAHAFTFRRCALILFAGYSAVFVAYPVLRAFVGALQHWNPITGETSWVGMANFRKVLADSLFRASLWRSLGYCAAATLLRVVVGLALALLLSSKLVRARNTLRTLFFLPTLTPLVAVSLVWGWMFDPGFGLVGRLSGSSTDWLHDPLWAMPVIIGLTVWKDFGYAVVLYLAALLNVPRDLTDAARVDGANALQVFRYVTLPSIRHTTWFIVVVSIIGYLQMYVPVIMLTDGGPGDATTTAGYFIYRNAFKLFDFGAASAMSVVMFVLLVAIVAVIFLFADRGEGDR